MTPEALQGPSIANDAYSIEEDAELEVKAQDAEKKALEAVRNQAILLRDTHNMVYTNLLEAEKEKGRADKEEKRANREKRRADKEKQRADEEGKRLNDLRIEMQAQETRFRACIKENEIKIQALEQWKRDFQNTVAAEKKNAKRARIEYANKVVECYNPEFAYLNEGSRQSETGNGLV